MSRKADRHKAESDAARRAQWREVPVGPREPGSWWTKHSTGAPVRPVEPRTGENAPDVAPDAT